MYERIVVAVDGSSRARGVIPYARLLADSIGADLSLLRVVTHEGEEAAAEESVSAVAASFDCEWMVKFMDRGVAEAILAEASTAAHTLVAVATRGHGDAVSALIGSTARQLVHLSPSPVLVYNPEDDGVRFDVAQIREVVLPLDGSTISESMRLEAIYWAQALNATLTIVNVVSGMPGGDLREPTDVLDSNYAAVRASSISREFSIEVNYEVFHGDAAASILGYVDSRRDTLVVIATRGQRPIQSALFGSVTTRIVRGANVPLIVQAPRKISSVR